MLLISFGACDGMFKYDIKSMLGDSDNMTHVARHMALQTALENSEIVELVGRVPIDKWISEYTGMAAQKAYSADLAIKESIIKIQICRTGYETNHVGLTAYEYTTLILADRKLIGQSRSDRVSNVFYNIERQRANKGLGSVDAMVKSRNDERTNIVYAIRDYLARRD